MEQTPESTKVTETLTDINACIKSADVENCDAPSGKAIVHNDAERQEQSSAEEKKDSNDLPGVHQQAVSEEVLKETDPVNSCSKNSDDKMLSENGEKFCENTQENSVLNRTISEEKLQETSGNAEIRTNETNTIKAENVVENVVEEEQKEKSSEISSETIEETLLQTDSMDSGDKVNESITERANATSDDGKDLKDLNPVGEDSEYETFEEDNLEEERLEDYGSEESDEGEEEEEEDGVLNRNRERSGSSSPEIVINEERQAADGQESDKKERKLDHDEDRRDPQYIPKKGMFYEHDDRTADGEEQKKDPVRDTKKGKVWDSKESWTHDLYVESEQAMKSTEEIIEIYGYDIRKDDGPPKARRRRRYVKGPNKYDRNWEDEQAYIKSPGRGGFRGGVRRGRGGGRNSFGSGTDSQPLKEFEYRPSDFPVHQPKKTTNRYTSPPREENWDPAVPKSPRTPPQQQNNHQQQVHNKNQHSAQRRLQKPALQSSVEKQVNIKPANVQNNAFHGSRKDESKNDEIKTESGKQGTHPLFQVPQGQPSQRGRGRGRLAASRPPAKHVRLSDPSNENHRFNSHDKIASSGSPHQQAFPVSRSTADEDIAMLAQHFSQAVINIDNKNIIRTANNAAASQQSAPLTLTQVVQQHQQQQLQQQLQQQSSLTEKYKIEESSTAVDKSEHQRSKRYSTQRQRALPAIQQGQVGGPSSGAGPQQQPSVVPQGLPPPPQHVPPPPAFMHQQPPPPPTAFYHTGCVEPEVVAAGQPVEVVTFLQPPPALHYVQPQFIPTPTGPITMQTPPPAGPEMYQGGGITYYNTLSQMTQNRPNCGTSRRLKVAIPIVAPPQDQQQLAGGAAHSA